MQFGFRVDSLELLSSVIGSKVGLAKSADVLMGSVQVYFSSVLISQFDKFFATSRLRVGLQIFNVRITLVLFFDSLTVLLC